MRLHCFQYPLRWKYGQNTLYPHSGAAHKHMHVCIPHKQMKTTITWQRRKFSYLYMHMYLHNIISIYAVHLYMMSPHHDWDTHSNVPRPMCARAYVRYVTNIPSPTIDTQDWKCLNESVCPGCSYWCGCAAGLSLWWSQADTRTDTCNKVRGYTWTIGPIRLCVSVVGSLYKSYLRTFMGSWFIFTFCPVEMHALMMTQSDYLSVWPWCVITSRPTRVPTAPTNRPTRVSDHKSPP